MDTAKYGRMALGRCIKRNYGYIGQCAADYQALEFMDSKCSGRRQCSFNVFDSGIRSLQPCPDDLAAYLETSYSCIKGNISMNFSHFQITLQRNTKQVLFMTNLYTVMQPYIAAPRLIWLQHFYFYYFFSFAYPYEENKRLYK